jgi:hypothetical protein
MLAGYAQQSVIDFRQVDGARLGRRIACVVRPIPAETLAPERTEACTIAVLPKSLEEILG